MWVHCTFPNFRFPGLGGVEGKPEVVPRGSRQNFLQFIFEFHNTSCLSHFLNLIQYHS